MTSLQVADISDTKETLTRKPVSGFFASASKALHLTPKPPLLPLTFAPNPRTPTRSSHSSFDDDLPTRSNDVTDFRDPVKPEPSIP
jgi:hypothetical protein